MNTARIQVFLPRIFEPANLVLFVAAPILLLCLTFSSSDFNVYWGQPFFFTLTWRVQAVAGITILWMGCKLGSTKIRTNIALALTEMQLKRFQKISKLFFAVTVSAYAAWFIAALSRGLSIDVLFQMLRGENGQSYLLKGYYFETIPLITTWTQIGVVFTSMAILVGRFLGKWPTFQIVTVYLLTLFRAFFVSERLALIELVVANVFVYVATSEKLSMALSKPLRTVYVVLTGWAAVFIFFGVSEFFRSWLNFYSTRQIDFWLFVNTRLSGYYATALNNASLVGERGGTLDKTLALFNFPFLTNLIGVGTHAQSPLQYLLYENTNPEFNNVSGLLAPQVCCGFLVGCAVLFWIGFTISRIASKIHANPMHLIFLACSVVGILEVVRLSYFFDSRFSPILLAIVCSGFALVEKNLGPVLKGTKND